MGFGDVGLDVGFFELIDVVGDCERKERDVSERIDKQYK